MPNQDPTEMYHFLIEELEYQLKRQKTAACLYGFLGGVLGFALCMILVACTVNREPLDPTPEPRAAVCMEEFRI